MPNPILTQPLLPTQHQGFFIANNLDPSVPIFVPYPTSTMTQLPSAATSTAAVAVANAIANITQCPIPPPTPQSSPLTTAPDPLSLPPSPGQQLVLTQAHWACTRRCLAPTAVLRPRMPGYLFACHAATMHCPSLWFPFWFAQSPSNSPGDTPACDGCCWSARSFHCTISRLFRFGSLLASPQASPLMFLPRVPFLAATPLSREHQALFELQQLYYGAVSAAAAASNTHAGLPFPVRSKVAGEWVQVWSLIYPLPPGQPKCRPCPRPHPHSPGLRPSWLTVLLNGVA